MTNYNHNIIEKLRHRYYSESDAKPDRKKSVARLQFVSV
ncbi:hypothetical protein GDI0190 [Gluconacetobacter diazotrophicus PA1 5]|uniref:Uncharacterized protein n=1 Tax=Gluconacetobacter diazotrophicus (strain ATCC 49037 / DSM 5601 / CCUG 37298 / CIP 103539 / LMG 7603 / PAl5) TaxID=272568 RepID=A9H2B9_GLUDA|nr:hypothetical protein GDI0190 [Gluconacetobacter diazotrophicus PA1 5]